jgi:hypothetical protein
MATAPNLIDQSDQLANQSRYWERRQSLTFGGSGTAVPLQALRGHDWFLLQNTVSVACAAGTKKSFKFDNMHEKWDGNLVSDDVNGDPDLVFEDFKKFQKKQFSSMRKKLEECFGGIRSQDSQVLSFIDVGIEMRPVDESQVLIANLGRSKSLISEICTAEFSEEVSVSSTIAEDFVTEENSIGEAIPVEDNDVPALLESTFVERLEEVKCVTPATRYPKHFSKSMAMCTHH